MLDRWKAEGAGLQLQPSQRPPLGHLPVSTGRPLDRHNPLLAMSVRKWMRSHGKTVKPKLTEEQTANLRMCFKMMDADGSGAIDAGELHAAFKLLGLNVTKKEVEAMLDEVDRDGSGEVEYAEFLEIMTVQLNRMAEEQRDGGGSSSSEDLPDDSTQDGSGSGGGSGGQAASAREGGAGGVPNAAALPFDIVATAYRRKKLLEALDLDDKDFLRSVAEEEERRAAEQAAAPPPPEEQPGGGRSSPSRLGASRGPIIAQTNAEFLQMLGKEERKVIGALARKFRECHQASKAASAAQERQRGSSMAHRAGTSYGRAGIGEFPSGPTSSPPSNKPATAAGRLQGAASPHSHLAPAAGVPPTSRRPYTASPGLLQSLQGKPATPGGWQAPWQHAEPLAGNPAASGAPMPGAAYAGYRPATASPGPLRQAGSSSALPVLGGSAGGAATALPSAAGAAWHGHGCLLEAAAVSGRLGGAAAPRSPSPLAAASSSAPGRASAAWGVEPVLDGDMGAVTREPAGGAAVSAERAAALGTRALACPAAARVAAAGEAANTHGAGLEAAASLAEATAAAVAEQAATAAAGGQHQDTVAVAAEHQAAGLTGSGTASCRVATSLIGYRRATAILDSPRISTRPTTSAVQWGPMSGQPGS